MAPLRLPRARRRRRARGPAGPPPRPRHRRARPARARRRARSRAAAAGGDAAGAAEPAGSPGYHWYLVPRVGYPDHDSFHAARAALAELHDRLWEETGVGPERTVLGGFSMGAVMSYAMALGADRPAVAGILAFSGFVPTVEGWEPSFADRSETRAFIAHGRRDPIIEVGFARRARELLEAGGLDGQLPRVRRRPPDRPRRTWPTRPPGWARRWPAERYSDCCQERPLGVARLTSSWRSKKRLAVARRAERAQPHREAPWRPSPSPSAPRSGSRSGGGRPAGRSASARRRGRASPCRRAGRSRRRRWSGAVARVADLEADPVAVGGGEDRRLGAAQQALRRALRRRRLPLLRILLRLRLRRILRLLELLRLRWLRLRLRPLLRRGLARRAATALGRPSGAISAWADGEAEERDQGQGGEEGRPTRRSWWRRLRDRLVTGACGAWP